MSQTLDDSCNFLNCRIATDGMAVPKCVTTSEPSDKVCPSKCYASGDGLKKAIATQPTMFMLHTVTDDERECEKVMAESISCQLITRASGRPRTVTGSIVEHSGNTFVIQYTPTQPQNGFLHVKIDGEPVMNSPFPVVVSVGIALHAMASGPIEVMQRLSEPNGIAVLSDRTRVITEDLFHRVRLFTALGEQILSFGTKGTGPGELRHPAGVAVDALDNIYVVDSGNNRIQKFSRNGEFIAVVGERGHKKLQFKSPFGIDVDHVSGRVYVADVQNHRIQVLNEDLSYSHQFGGKGKSKGQFKQPHDVAVSLNGNVYVADSDNNRIQIFSLDGQFIQQFGPEGKQESLFDRPKGIAVDCAENVVVSNTHQHQVCVFNAHGNLLLVLGKQGLLRRLNNPTPHEAMCGNAPGEFDHPMGIAVDTGGFVYVLDQYNNRMQMYL